MKLFRQLPTPLLTLATVVSVFLMGLDLIVLDPLPLIDEAFLLFMTAGTTTELISRFRGLRRLSGDAGDRVRLSLSDQRLVQETLASLPVRISALMARARVLEDLGHPSRLFGPLQPLSERIGDQLQALREHEGEQSRRDNDPWQIRRQIQKLERAIARRQVGRPTRKLGRMRAELIELQEHEIRTLARLAVADEGKRGLLSLSSQVDVLADDLTRLAAPDPAGGARSDIPIRALDLPDLEPALAEVAVALRDFARAEAEVDGAASSASGATTPQAPRTRTGS
jgi:hypothetical protein